MSVASLARSGELEPVLDARFDADELKGASAIIKDEERCIRCGLCAVRCPADAITMERMTFEQPWSEAVA
ncbi:MAG: 4Fe-4S binding protein [Phycisphaeraceae bacterium]|nr:4Fe-4S binding protein [Phycisphaeraceae bacterium]